MNFCPLQELLEGYPIDKVPLAAHVPMNPESAVPEGVFAGMPRLRHVSGQYQGQREADLKVFGCSIDFLQTATQTYPEDPIWDKLQQSMECTVVFRDSSAILPSQELDGN